MVNVDILPESVKCLLDTVRQEFLAADIKYASIEVALSGGVDSVVLLHILSCLKEELGFKLYAVHINHGLQHCADEWVDFCKKLCGKFDVPLRVEKVTVSKDGLGVEAAARRERYRVFGHSSAKVLAMAHHRDDQVETFILAALRGGGTRALSAMPKWRKLTEHLVAWRPLLDVSRSELESYAAECSLNYVEDPSNGDSTYLRNWVRHQLMPVLHDRVPFIKQHILHSVSALQNELALLDEVIQEDFKYIMQPGFFDVVRWRKLSELRKKQQLKFFVKQCALGYCRGDSVADFSRVLSEIGNYSALWKLPEGEIYAYANRLFILRNGWQSEYRWLSCPLHFDKTRQNLMQDYGFVLSVSKLGLSREGIKRIKSIRAVNSVDSLNLTVCRKNIVKILKERKVPPFIRHKWPVLVDENDRCIAVANIAVDHSHAVDNGFLPVFESLNQFIVEPKSKFGVY